MSDIDMTGNMGEDARPSRLRNAIDWAILVTGVSSLAVAVVASTTGLI